MYKNSATSLLMSYGNLTKPKLIGIALAWIKWNYNALDCELLQAVRQSKQQIEKLNSTIFKTEIDKIEYVKFIIVDNL